MPVLKNFSGKNIAGTSSRDFHSCLWRKHSFHIHVAPSSFSICVAALRLDQIRAALA
jgi:hypothetical protein